MEREQAERREYVKNLGIEYRFGCYEVSAFQFDDDFFLVSQVGTIHKRSMIRLFRKKYC